MTVSHLPECSLGNVEVRVGTHLPRRRWSECGPGAGSIGITWELVRNAQFPPATNPFREWSPATCVL